MIALLHPTEVVARKVGSVQWLRNMPPANFQNFYQLASTMTSAQVEVLCTRQITATQEQSWGWANSGEFRPLGYWKSQGYDTEKIERNAKEEDKEEDPMGWVNYRVRVKSTHDGATNSTKDNLRVLAKARTRALKRRRTDESDLPLEDNQESDFSEEASGNSSSEHPAEKKKRYRSTGKAQAKPKGKAKAKANSAAEKEKAKIKKAATSAAKKIKDALASLRSTASHHLILEVPDDLLQACKARMAELVQVQRLCNQGVQHGVAGWQEEFNALEWDAIKKDERALKKKLDRLEKAF